MWTVLVAFGICLFLGYPVYALGYTRSRAKEVRAYVWWHMLLDVCLLLACVKIAFVADVIMSEQGWPPGFMIFILGLAYFPFVLIFGGMFMLLLGVSAGRHSARGKTRIGRYGILLPACAFVGLLLMATVWSTGRDFNHPDGTIRMETADVAFDFPYFDHVDPSFETVWNQGSTSEARLFSVESRLGINVLTAPEWQKRCEEELAGQARCKYAPPPTDYNLDALRYSFGGEGWNAAAIAKQLGGVTTADLENTKPDDNGWKIVTKTWKQGELEKLTAVRETDHGAGREPAVLDCDFGHSGVPECSTHRKFSKLTAAVFRDQRQADRFNADYPSQPPLRYYTYPDADWEDPESVGRALLKIDQEQSEAVNWLRQFQVR